MAGVTEEDVSSNATGTVVVGCSLHKTFAAGSDAPVRALRGLDLQVNAGEFVAVTGPSGCGKSTLVNVLSGLEPADSGTVTIAGQTMTGADDDERTLLRRSHVGIVFQQYHLLDALSALDNVAVAMTMAGVNRDEAVRRARDLLSLVALGTKLDVSLSSLSGGQRQRVGIARALANNPTLVLADEPTGALDSDGASEIGELFARLNERGQTIVVVTHDARLAAIAHRVEHMTDGRLTGVDPKVS